MSDEEKELTEKEEVEERINRAKLGITDHLIQMGVKPDAAMRAVESEVRFGLFPGNRTLMKRGKWEGSTAATRECALPIKADLPPEAFSNYQEDDENGPGSAWELAERRLAEANPNFSRGELRQQEKQADLERILNPQPEAPPSDERLRKLAEVQAFI